MARHRLRDQEQNRTSASTPRLTHTANGPYDVAALVPSQAQDHAETMELLWRPDGDQMEASVIRVVAAETEPLRRPWSAAVSGVRLSPLCG